MFRRLLVANRGEVAARVIRACRELGVQTVAVHSTADAESPHLALADRTVCIGPGPAASSYLDMDAILQAAEQTDCQALHPGWGQGDQLRRYGEGAERPLPVAGR